jgi:hypothetical protein
MGPFADVGTVSRRWAWLGRFGLDHPFALGATMTEGLITRIGKWIDHKWAAKATWLDVQEQETRCSQRHIGMMGLITDLKPELRSEFSELLDTLRDGLMEVDRDMANRIAELAKSIKSLQMDMASVSTLLNSPSEEGKELAALKTRIEQLELYTNMSRKVDPTKPAVAKSAFAM